LGDQTAFAEKVPLAEQGDYRFPPLLGGYDDFDLAPQNVEDGVGGVSLRENDPFAPKLKFGSVARNTSGSNRVPLAFLAMIQLSGPTPEFVRPKS
jgi:hypothetical protein